MRLRLNNAMSLLKQLVRMFLLGLRNLLDPFVGFREVAVLCYHRYDPHLAGHLSALEARGYSFVPLADVAAWAAGRESLPHKAVALTFDDGYADFDTLVLSALEGHRAPVTLFAVGEWREGDYLTSEALERLRANPLVTVGCHSKTHPKLSALSDEALSTEVVPPHGEHYFAYPGGNHSPAVAAALRDAGYEAAFTIRPVGVTQGMNPYLLPRSVILPEMSVRDVLFYESRAAWWYRALKVYG